MHSQRPAGVGEGRPSLPLLNRLSRPRLPLLTILRQRQSNCLLVWTGFRMAVCLIFSGHLVPRLSGAD